MARFTIVGGGLAGCLLANYLAQAGNKVDVYERRPDMRKAEVPRGRSINLALSVRGLHALREVGLENEVLAQAIPMKGRMIHGVDGHTELQPYSIYEHEWINSVSRHGLNVLLMDAAGRHAGVRFFFNQKLQGHDIATNTLEFVDEMTHEVHHVQADTVIGADGAFSAVRAGLQRRDRYDYHQNYLDWGYKELTMPAGPDGSHRLFTNALHIWPRHDFMLIALPNLDGSFTCTLFLPFEGAHSFGNLHDDAAVEEFFGQQFGDAVPHMPTLLDDYHHNPTSSLVYVRCAPWHIADRVVLVGDACHAVVPFYGQGMNAAFEDCSVLWECIAGCDGNLGAAYARYEILRRPNTDALAELSLRNFEEMRAGVVSRTYQLKKQVEKVLYRLAPDQCIPLYSMVTFSRIPYAEALARAKRQDRIIKSVGMTAAIWGPIKLLKWLRKRHRED